MAVTEIPRRESRIVTAIRGGDVQGAFELLLGACQDSVYAYCARLSRPGDALALYGRTLKFATDELARITVLPRAWLYRIARGVIVHYHGKERMEGALLDRYAPVMSPAGEQEHDDQLTGLDPESREVLQLALWQGLRLREVAYVVRRPLALIRQEAAHGLMMVAMDRRHRSELLS